MSKCLYQWHCWSRGVEHTQQSGLDVGLTHSAHVTHTAINRSPVSVGAQAQKIIIRIKWKTQPDTHTLLTNTCVLAGSGRLHVRRLSKHRLYKLGKRSGNIDMHWSSCGREITPMFSSISIKLIKKQVTCLESEMKIQYFKMFFNALYLLPRHSSFKNEIS